MITPDLSAVPTARLQSWQREHERAIAEKQAVMARHAPGIPYHTRAKLECETRQTRLARIVAELARR